MEIKNKIGTKTIIILGMHKSGTSLIAGILKILGVNMGKELIGPHWSNPLGHFENKKFVKLNDKILKEAGGSWDNPPKKEDILALKEKCSSEIKVLISEEQSEIWGFKDPRTSLIIEFYLPYLENPYFVVCYRSPLAIAQSLLERDQIEIKTSLALNKVYREEIEKFFERHPYLKRLDLKFEEILKSPKENLQKLIEFLQIQPAEGQFREALEFIHPPEAMEKLAKRMKRKNNFQMIKTRIFRYLRRICQHKKAMSSF